jgi:hypothetical protein
VVVACLDRALLRSLILVSEHMCLEVLENFSAFWVSAASFLS